VGMTSFIEYTINRCVRFEIGLVSQLALTIS
jgi:hypothetical protein